MRGVALWAKASRAQFLTATLVPVLVGTAKAFEEVGRVNLALLWLALLSMALIHLGVNLANDYFDHLSGADDLNPAPLSPLAGGSRVIQEGLLSAVSVLRGALLLLGLGVSLGLLLSALTGILLLLIGAFGVLTGYFYTAPPLKLGYRGLGELCVALDFGVLPTLGAFYVQTGRLSLGALLASLPVSFLVASILWANEIPDIPYDKRAGKLTLVARLGPKRAAIGLGILFGLGALSTGALAVFEGRVILLLPLLATPLVLGAAAKALKGLERPESMEPACKLTILSHLVWGVLLATALFL